MKRAAHIAESPGEQILLGEPVNTGEVGVASTAEHAADGLWAYLL
jgi:hypothetical protein